MAPVTLPIRKPNFNVEPQAKVLSIDYAVDCYYENTGEGTYCIRRRPGYTQFSNPASGGVGQGIIWSDRFAAAFAVAGGKLYKIASDGTATQITGSALNAVNKVVFAEGQDLALSPFIYIAHGGYLRYTNGSVLYSLSDANTPQATYVASLNNRFFADDGGQDFLITDTNTDGLIDPFYWSFASNPFRTAMDSDLLKAIYAAWNEVAMMGTKSIEYWQEDGVTPVSPLVGAKTEAGIVAPYSLLMLNNSLHALFAMGGKRAVVKLSNRSPQILSGDIDRELQSLTTAEDAVGASCFAGGMNTYLLDFPTERVTWAYDLKESIWTRWGKWNSVESRYDSFPVAGSCYAKAWNKHLFLGNDGVVYQFDRDTFQDAGNEIRTVIRTGHINHGTANNKISKNLTLKVKTYRPEAATLLLRYRDDGRPEWSSYIEIPIGSASEQIHFVPLDRMGMYRSRQYEFLMTDNSDLALMGLTEDIEVCEG